jgi:hypothetical protein
VISQIRQSPQWASSAVTAVEWQECTSQIPRGALPVACTAKSCFPAKVHGCGKKNAGCPCPVCPMLGFRAGAFTVVGKPSSLASSRLVSSPLLSCLSDFSPSPLSVFSPSPLGLLVASLLLPELPPSLIPPSPMSEKLTVLLFVEEMKTPI